MFRSNNWILSCRGLKNISEFERGNNVPPVAVPVTLSMLGLCDMGKAFIFENFVEGDFITKFGIPVSQKSYYVLYMEQQYELLKLVLRYNNDDIIWVIAEENPEMKYFEHPITKETVEAAVIDGIYIGIGTPEEAKLIDWG